MKKKWKKMLAVTLSVAVSLPATPVYAGKGTDSAENVTESADSASDQEEAETTEEVTEKDDEAVSEKEITDEKNQEEESETDSSDVEEDVDIADGTEDDSVIEDDQDDADESKDSEDDSEIADEDDAVVDDSEEPDQEEEEETEEDKDLADEEVAEVDNNTVSELENPPTEELVQVEAEEKDTVDIPVAVLYLDESEEDGYRIGDQTVQTFQCSRNNPGHDTAFKHKVTGRRLYAGVMEAVGDVVDEDEYEILGVTSYAASANPTYNVKEDGGTAFSYSDGTTATLYLVVKEKKAQKDEVTIPTAILYLDETAENGYRVGDESSVTFDCVRNKPEGHEGFKHQVLGKNLYAGVTEKYKDSVDTDKYEILGVTSFGASANPTCNIKEDGGTAFSYSDGTTATLYLVVKEKKAQKDEVTIPTAILYLDESAENGYRVGEEDSVTFDCVRNKPEGHEGFKHQVLGKKLYAGITEKYKDSVDTDKYEVVGVTSFGASAIPTCNIKEDGGTAFSYSDGTTATLYLVVKAKKEQKDEVTIPTAILYLDESAENGYRVGDESSVTFDCVRNKLEGHEGFKHQVLGKNLYAGVTEKYKDSVDTDKYEILGVTSYAASANPTYNVKEDGGTAFSYSDGTTATLYLVVKEKKAPVSIKYTVSFKGADDVTGLPDDLTAESAEDEVTFTLPSEVPSCNGYTFAGWATEEDGTVVYGAGQEIALNADVQSLTLYAVWQKNAEPSKPDVPSEPDTPNVPSKPDDDNTNGGNNNGDDNGNNNGSNNGNSGGSSSGNSGSHSGGGSSSSSSGGSGSSSTSVSGNWKKNENGIWSYILSNNSSASGWKSISGTNGSDWYHFANDGTMDTGWYRESDVVWYYLETSEEREGRAVDGWMTDSQDGNTYYLDPATKVMATGWKQIDGAWYFFNDVHGNGWTYEETNGKWVFIEGSSLPLGAMLKNTTTPDGYQVDADGKWINQ